MTTTMPNSPPNSPAMLSQAKQYPCWSLNWRQRCDLELLLNGAFAPLTGYLNQADYDSVLKTMHLTSGELWPMPIVLDVTEAFAENLNTGDNICLRDDYGFALATLEIGSIWQADKTTEAQAVFGTDDAEHPGVQALYDKTHPVYIGGKVTALQTPQHFSFQTFRHTPEELKHEFAKRGWQKIIGFQTRNPLHKAHHALAQYAQQKVGANLLIHPTVGVTAPHDINYFSRVRCYLAALKHFPAQTTQLSLLPLAMRMAGPREAVWHALIRQNYGCTHFIVGRDHASPVNNGYKLYYEPYAAESLLHQYQHEMKIETVCAKEIVYVKNRDLYLPTDELGDNDDVQRLSGKQFRTLLNDGREVPEWFSYPEVVTELRDIYPPKHAQGLVILLTGLPAAGKTTLARALHNKLREMDTRHITHLDGDEIRQILSPNLGYQLQDRLDNLKRIGYVASVVGKHRGIALCSVIAPYHQARISMRQMAEAHGHFFEVYVSTPLATCEQRDFKGLYAKARAGQAKHVTGIDDVYEKPEHADLVINMAETAVADAVSQIILQLENLNWLRYTE
jgi:sulfate adenylyltransferase